ncbi:hypothetical protein AtNW77_Chr5g0121751 [Arabidopsis thaliana]
MFLLQHCLMRELDGCRHKNTALILRLAFQTSVYTIWKERNSRLHTASSKRASILIKRD